MAFFADPCWQPRHPEQPRQPRNSTSTKEPHTMEGPPEATWGLRAKQGGQICEIFPREWDIAHPWNRKKKKKKEKKKNMEPRILLLKTKRLVGLKKETFEEVIRKAGILCQYFCRKSFATWDVLLPTEEQATKAAANNIITKHFRLQPEYKGTRRLRVTVSMSWRSSLGSAWPPI